jgi:hypothetical protein
MTLELNKDINIFSENKILSNYIMENEIAKIIQTKKADLSAMSIKTYANAVNKVMELMGSTALNDLITKADEVIKTLKEKYEKPNTIKTKIASIVVLLKSIDPPKPKAKKAFEDALAIYGKSIESLTGDIKKDLSDGEKTDKMKTNWLSAEEVDKLKVHLKSLVPEEVKSSKDLAHFRNYVLYLLYEDLPTRNDLADSKIIFSSPSKLKELSDEWNYILLDKRTKKIKYLLNNYKTAKSYGQKVISLNDNLYSIMVAYKNAVDKYNGGQSWAFLNNNATEKLSRNRLGVVYKGLGDFVGKKLGTTLNRHLAVSRVVPLKAMKDLADKMGHSVPEAVEIYAKV